MYNTWPTILYEPYRSRYTCKQEIGCKRVKLMKHRLQNESNVSNSRGWGLVVKGLIKYIA